MGSGALRVPDTASLSQGRRRVVTGGGTVSLCVDVRPDKKGPAVTREALSLNPAPSPMETKHLHAVGEVRVGDVGGGILLDHVLGGRIDRAAALPALRASA